MRPAGHKPIKTFLLDPCTRLVRQAPKVWSPGENRGVGRRQFRVCLHFSGRFSSSERDSFSGMLLGWLCVKEIDSGRQIIP